MSCHTEDFRIGARGEHVKYCECIDVNIEQAVSLNVEIVLSRPGKVTEKQINTKVVI